MEGRIGADHPPASGVTMRTLKPASRMLGATLSAVLITASAPGRETADRSTDGGKTWTPWFDIVFRPHRDR
jgi:hypothetical protein